MKSLVCPVVATLALLTFASSASAQSFPGEADWDAFECGDLLAFDAIADEAGALNERDIVGDQDAPAGFRATDADFLYLRMRVEDDPTAGTSFQSFAWAVLVDIDGDLTTYEVSMVLDGVAGELILYQNTTTDTLNDPTEPPDAPSIASYAIATHTQSLALTDGNFDGDSDYSVDLAIPWADLEALGLEPTTELSLWMVTASSSNVLDGDLACHDGSSGPPRLEDGASESTVSDTEADSDGDGYTDAEEIDQGSDPNDEDSVPETSQGARLEGGGGCALIAGAGSESLLAFGILLLLGWLRRCQRLTEGAELPPPHPHHPG